MAEKKKKAPARPRWWLNTYFIFGIILVIVALMGFVRGSDYVRDPGQPDNSSLAMWYLVASVLFFINGYVSHQDSVRQFEIVSEE